MKKTNFKKLVSVMIALVMVMTTFAMIPLTASANATAPAVWDGTTVDTSWVDAKTGADWANAYEIADGADLAGWSKLSNETIGRFDGKYFKLTADIDLGSHHFTPIVGGIYNATGKAEVTGGAIHLDGQNFKIKNLKIEGEGSKYAIINGSKYQNGESDPKNTQVANQYSSALFANLGDNSEVRNLHFVGANIDNNTNAVAATAVLVGYGSLKNCTFWNISIDETSVVQRGGSVGAIVAMVCDNRTDGTDADVTVFRYCVNKATINGTGAGGRYGGLVGTWQIGTDLDFDYCANLGDIVNATTGAYVGAMVGTGMNDGNGTNKAQNMSFKNCYNTGSIIGESQTGGTQSGMVGDFRFYANSTLTLENCYDYSVRKVAAGFTGQLFAIGAPSNDANMAMNVTLKNCYAAPKTGSATTSTGTPITPSDFAAYNNDFAATAKVALASYRGNNLAQNPVENSYMVASAAAEIVTDVANDTKSTIADEIARIDAAIANQTPVEDDQGGGNPNATPYDNGWGAETLDYSWYYTNGALVAKGTVDAPYEIASGAQLAALSALTNALYTPADVGETEAVAKDFAGKYFKLTADIDLLGKAFKPIVAGAIVLDGNNKTISNLKVEAEVNAGLFASLGAGAEIKNLKIVGANVSGLGLAAVLSATAMNDLTVYNVHIDATSVVNSMSDAAAFVTKASDTTAVDPTNAPKAIEFTYCSTKATVNGASNVAGYIAYLKTLGDAIFDYCTNEGALTATSETGSPRIAGIVANCSDVSGHESISLKFTNCYNKGKLSYSITANEYSFCAGIVARLWTAESNCDLLIYNCYDYSERDVSSTGSRSASNSAIMGSAKSGMIKDLDICYAANPLTTTNAFSAIHSANVTAELTMGIAVVVELVDSQIINQFGNSSTMAAEMGKIDTAIATLTPIPVEDPTTPPPTGGTEGGGTEGGGTEGGGTTDTTTTPETTTPAAEEKGCGSSVNAMYAVLALTAIVGCAFVAKRKEEN